jgi:hypothetical protein
MTITFQIRTDPDMVIDLIFETKKEKRIFTPKELKQMYEYMLEFVDDVYNPSKREYTRAEMYVNGERYDRH